MRYAPRAVHQSQIGMPARRRGTNLTDVAAVVPRDRLNAIRDRELERFEELLNDLLEISRHDAGAATLALERADIRDSVLQAVREAEQIAEKRGIKVILRLPTEPCTAEFDSRRINRILRNLIVNAIEHSEGKDVIVTAAAAGGIPPPLLDQLKPGGRMVIPVGGGFALQYLVLVEKTPEGKVRTRQTLPVAFVPLVRGG